MLQFLLTCALVIVITIQESLQECDEKFTANNGSFSSPNYPSNYLASTTCVYTIEVDTRKIINLTFTDVMTEYEASCKYDNIKIYQETVLLDTLCGKIETPRPFIITSNKVTVIFKSDDGNQHRGFKAIYTTQHTECENIGFYGPNCNKVCHCYQSQCDFRTGVCDYGCKRGWMGSRCDQVKAPAEVATHCVNSPTKGKYALLRVDRKNVKYGRIYIIDGNNHTSSARCDQGMFIEDGDGVLNLKIKFKDDNTTSPSCYHTQIGKGVLKWTLRTEEVSGFYSYYDRLYELSCNFTTAHNLTSNSKQVVTGIVNPRKVDVMQTTEDVKLVTQNPVTSSPLSRVTVGTRIQLAMILYERGGISASGISPYNCIYFSSDFEVTYQLTDFNGCPVSGSPGFALTGINGSHLTSNLFDTFIIEGKLDVIFSCSFEFCFVSKDTKCSDRCVHMKNQSSLTTITKRSTNENRKNGQASAYLLLIPKTQKDKQTDKNNFSEDSDGTIPKYLTVLITGLILAVCAVWMTVLIFVRSFYIRSGRRLANVETAK
ncbi:neuropilin and tolloid-like protein 1 [Patella vulgata]|uniref:neuropilin and tolloid-like protein 1 n=1 Tax=Patella vulgata TaxID=6465 RepID=UPI00217FBEF8|nr:neuropilin and tolloid-like protein 1 [Patella vulgata]